MRRPRVMVQAPCVVDELQPHTDELKSRRSQGRRVADRRGRLRKPSCGVGTRRRLRRSGATSRRWVPSTAGARRSRSGRPGWGR